MRRSRFIYYFGLGMVVVYIVLGLLLVLYDVPLSISRNSRMLVGVLLILYGLARAYTRHRKLRQQEREEEDDILNSND
jgi:uncharacterized membrane protein